jgi:hypothetical protein
MAVRCRWASDQTYCMKLEAASLGHALAGTPSADVAAAKAGKRTYDGEKAQACLDAFGTAGCDNYLAAFASTYGLACKEVFIGGSVPDGDPCISSSECLLGSTCEIIASDLCIGTCTHSTSCVYGPPCPKDQVCDENGGVCVTPVPPGAADEACGTNDTCQTGLYCDIGGACHPIGAEGQSCWAEWGCAAGLTCTPNDGRSIPISEEGICRKIAAKGEPCQAVNQCGGILLSAIHCDMTSQVCVDNTSDGPCFSTDPSDIGRNGCDPFTSYCDGSTSTLTCRPYALAIGDPCNGNNPECGLFAWCQPDPVNVTPALCAAYPVCTP